MGALSDRQMAFFAAKGLTLQDAIEFAQLSDEVEVATPQRSAGAIRQERYRKNLASRNNVCDVTGDEKRDVTSVTQGPSAAPQRDIIKPPTTSSKSNSGADAKTILAKVVSIETADEIIAYRKAIRSPMTAGAAKGLAKNLAASGDAEKAAASMMANGWRGYKPEWDRPSPRAGPQAQAKRNPHIAAFERDMGYARPDDHHGPTIDCRASADDGKRSLQSDWLAQEQDRARQDRRAMLADERNAERRLENQDRR